MLQVHVPGICCSDMSPCPNWYFYICAKPIWGIFCRRDVCHKVQQVEFFATCCRDKISSHILDVGSIAWFCNYWWMGSVCTKLEGGVLHCAASWIWKTSLKGSLPKTSITALCTHSSWHSLGFVSSSTTRSLLRHQYPGGQLSLSALLFEWHTNPLGHAALSSTRFFLHQYPGGQ